MAKDNTQRLKDWINVLFTAMTLLATIVVFIIIGQGQVESDTLWHIKAGQWAIENGIPRTDPFSWTMRGEEWFAHEWLWEVSAAWIYSIFGYQGIWLFSCVWVGIFCTALWLLLRQRCSIHRATLIYVLTIISSSIFWNARPHPMAQALFACTSFILLECRHRPKVLVLLPLITVIWSNMHGSAPLGVLMAASYYVVTVRGFKFSWTGVQMAKLSAKSSQMLLFSTIASFGASLINPLGIHIWSYMWDVSNHPLMTKHILEWQSPNFHDLSLWPLLIFPIIVICLLTNEQNATTKKIPLFEFIMMCGFFVLAMKQIRHAPYFYFNGALVIGSLISDKPNVQAKFSLQKKTSLAVLFVASFILLSQVKPATWIEESSNFFPVSATKSLLKQEQVNNLFNDYGYGGYLIWCEVSPFIDGRADLYTFKSDIFKDYFAMQSTPQNYLDKYDIQTVLTESGSRLDLYLINNQEWKETFRDKYSAVYCKNHRFIPKTNEAV